MLTLQSPAIADFERVLEHDGILAGLHFLNCRVAHRYSAIYRLQHLTARNLYFYDREGALLPAAFGAVPLGDGFCQHALREGSFRTDDTRTDSRVNGSPFKGVVIAYHGLPLRDKRDQLFGSLCHFDCVPQSLSDAEFELLKEAACVLPAYLP